MVFSVERTELQRTQLQWSEDDIDDQKSQHHLEAKLQELVQPKVKANFTFFNASFGEKSEVKQFEVKLTLARFHFTSLGR